MTAETIVILNTPARRSASSSKTFTIDTDCTRLWAIARQPSSKQCFRSLGLIHGVINKPRQQQQIQHVPSFRVSLEGCTPLTAATFLLLLLLLFRGIIRVDCYFVVRNEQAGVEYRNSFVGIWLTGRSVWFLTLEQVSFWLWRPSTLISEAI